MHFLLKLLIYEQILVAKQVLGHIASAKESTQFSLLFQRSFALPVAFQELFYIFRVHNLLYQ